MRKCLSRSGYHPAGHLAPVTKPPAQSSTGLWEEPDLALVQGHYNPQITLLLPKLWPQLQLPLLPGQPGEQPCQCDQCQARLSQCKHLLQHQLVHTGEKPHSCPDCGQRFHQRGSLAIHRRAHTWEKPPPRLQKSLHLPLPVSHPPAQAQRGEAPTAVPATASVLPTPPRWLAILRCTHTGAHTVWTVASALPIPFSSSVTGTFTLIARPSPAHNVGKALSAGMPWKPISGSIAPARA